MVRAVNACNSLVILAVCCCHNTTFSTLTLRTLFALVLIFSFCRSRGSTVLLPRLVRALRVRLDLPVMLRTALLVATFAGRVWW